MTGRIAVVTGGTGALGQAVARRLLAAGAVVWVTYRSASELRELETGLDEGPRTRLRAAQADVTREAEVGALAQQVLEAHGRIDALVNGVGGFAGGDLLCTSLAEWDRVMTLNLTSAVIGCRAVLPAMIRAGFGRIVNVSSRAVLPPQGGFTAYTVSKAAVITLTQTLAQEVRRHGITVNAVLPSTMDTPANRRAMPGADRSGWVSPDAVAGVIAYLTSDQAGAVSGAAIAV
jgi:NAD(P)-dependent dehydrogenase (short-subunit alcohol dehydrogenase family)